MKTTQEAQELDQWQYLDAEILVLGRTLSALRIQRDQAQERLDSYNYPVLTLPNEIIAEIFVHFIPKYPDFPPTSGLHSPALLTQICREWRELALRMPTLWRAITIPPLAEQAARLDAWLSRARGCPLSLFFDMDFSREEGSLSTIVPYREQLEYLVIFQGLPSHLQAIEGPLPMLRHLGLLFHDQDDPPTKVSFLEAPLLRAAFLDITGLQNIVLPWAQLTSLALDAVYPRECTPILQQTPNLVDCELILLEDRRAGDVPDVALPSLQSLTLATLLSDDSVTGYLQTLTIPLSAVFELRSPSLVPPPLTH
ncbi:hypothetical protein C8R45DRAFT_1081368 [Mycena sanguinolenta]|nr:hypothetical protein C8R45DRAFT_1081368 [Mycena sanguinolenta]